MNKLLKRYQYCLFAILVALFSSCEEVIDLKLDQTSPKIVIEGIFTDLNVRHTLSISTTTNFDASNATVPVTGGKVAIKEENGPTINFTEQSPGIYLSTRYKGTPGKRYTVTVTVAGKTYVATSIMPLVVPIKSLDQVDLDFFGETRKFVQVNYKDPIGIPNFYYNRLFVNNLKRSSFYVESDRFNDGKEVKNTIFSDEPDLVTGDKIKVQLLTIDAQVYNYLFSISQITGNGGPPTTPGNPISNFNNGALGYFSASTLTTDSLIIK
jgi:hypothetical protein